MAKWWQWLRLPSVKASVLERRKQVQVLEWVSTSVWRSWVFHSCWPWAVWSYCRWRKLKSSATKMHRATNGQRCWIQPMARRPLTFKPRPRAGYPWTNIKSLTWIRRVPSSITAVATPKPNWVVGYKAIHFWPLVQRGWLWIRSTVPIQVTSMAILKWRVRRLKSSLPTLRVCASMVVALSTPLAWL